ncbi:transposase [Ktedonobacter racemifer]|uniref:transposase n=1 Tax=Ktedonobacter racemifer TaxID=363277 RepID=UPI0012F7A554|nr:transposase [Ktedonobacter racemifer]
MDDLSKHHARFLKLSHLMFVCKYRKKLLLFSGNEVKQVFEEIAAHSDVSFEALEVDQDHIHCLVKSEPQMRTAGHRRQTETHLDHAMLAKACAMR